LHAINPDWGSWAIPKPSLEDVVNGALGINNKAMGYNPRFIYPKSGGIDCLPGALAKSVAEIHLNQPVEFIDSKRKFIRLESGREEEFDSLVCTLPLPLIFEMLTEAPDSLRHAASRLRAVSVLNINIGVDRPNISDQHWVYFPENQFIFSRIGFPMNFSESVVPPGASSIYIEITHPSDETPNVEDAFFKAIAGLQRCGILQPKDRLLTRHVLDIKYAYVVFDAHRQDYVQRLIDYLESCDIYPAGRYGRWDYYSMEDSILSGRAAADAIQAKMASACASVSFT